MWEPWTLPTRRVGKRILKEEEPASKGKGGFGSGTSRAKSTTAKKVALPTTKSSSVQEVKTSVDVYSGVGKDGVSRNLDMAYPIFEIPSLFGDPGDGGIKVNIVTILYCVLVGNKNTSSASFSVALDKSPLASRSSSSRELRCKLVALRFLDVPIHNPQCVSQVFSLLFS